MKHFLTTIRGRTQGRKFEDPKLGPKLGLLSFSQGCITSFLLYRTRLQLGTMSNIQWSWTPTPTKKNICGANWRQNYFFYYIMLSCVHLNLHVFSRYVQNNLEYLIQNMIHPLGNSNSSLRGGAIISDYLFLHDFFTFLHA